MSPPTARDYGGLSASERQADRRERLLQAGLEVIGTVGVNGLTVRRVIEQSGLAPRYFYESFGSLDELQVAVFDSVIAELEAAARKAILTAPGGARERIRAVITVAVHLLLEHPHKGRVVFVESLGSTCLAPLRRAATTRFAGLLAVQTRSVWRARAPTSHAVLVTSQFAIGGFAETVSSVLLGRLVVDPTVLIDDLTELFLGTGTAFRRMAAD